MNIENLFYICVHALLSFLSLFSHFAVPADNSRHNGKKSGLQHLREGTRLFTRLVPRGARAQPEGLVSFLLEGVVILDTALLCGVRQVIGCSAWPSDYQPFCNSIFEPQL